MPDNTTFILIRGLMRESRHWAEFPSILQQQFPLATILTPDIPGNGRLHQQTTPNSIHGITQQLRQHIKTEESIVLVGISMGGMIAIDWATRFPDDINAAVLINTSIRPLSAFYRRLRWQIYPEIINMLWLDRKAQEKTILELTSNHHRNNGCLLKNWYSWQQQYPVTAGNAGRQLLASARFSIQDKPRQPLLIVTSSADRLVDYHCSLTLHRHWQTAYAQHDSAGHDLTLDDPDWTASQIKQWIQTYR
ncbi:MAG: alpha/beta hydrolase [Gammaproteobacteria bacterium]|nr:alpha/beta hydrolase [Gammaproteobacteria bacterium]